jgi:hypothetical protein
MGFHFLLNLTDLVSDVHHVTMFIPQPYCAAPFTDTQQKSGRADPLPLHLRTPVLLLVDRFPEFGSRGEFGHFAGGNLDYRAGLRVAPIAGFSLRDGERAEPYQGYAVSLPQSAGYAVHHCVNGRGGLGLVNARTSRNSID